MIKRSVFLILVVLLAACSPVVAEPQAPAVNPTVSATEALTSEVETAWNTYRNDEAGFSIQYPADWQQQDLPDENDGQLHHVTVQGPEGGIELIWGTGLGGACPAGYEQVAVAQGTWPACHSQREDGTELWSLAPPSIGETNFGGFVYTNDTTTESREVALQVLSTLSFP